MHTLNVVQLLVGREPDFQQLPGVRLLGGGGSRSLSPCAKRVAEGRKEMYCRSAFQKVSAQNQSMHVFEWQIQATKCKLY